MKRVIFIFLCFLAFNLNAKVPVVDTIIGEAIDKMLLVAGKTSFEKFENYQVIDNPHEGLRIKRVVKELVSFSGHEFRYPNPQIRIIRGHENEPNAFSLGPVIYVTQSALEILNDNELSAVLAHEIAHAEYGHLLQRMVFVTGSPVLHLRNLIFSDIYTLTTGEADHTMRKIMSTGHLALVQEILENASLKQEIQADCLAANWLQNAKRLGKKVSPLDLNRAMLKVLGIDEAIMNSMDLDFPPYIRGQNVISGKYIGSKCLL